MGLLERVLARLRGATPAPDLAARRGPGWRAIEAAFARLYPGEPTLVPPRAGGDPLAEAIGIHDAGASWHYVTFGLTELAAKVMSDARVSGRGYELTMRVEKAAPDESTPPAWPADVLFAVSAAARRATFAPGHIARLGPLDGRPGTRAVGVAFVEDPRVPASDTPHGRVVFLALVGLTEDELARCEAGLRDEVFAALLARDDPGLTVTP